MPIPDSPRVLYGKNPLAEVICQLKFPPVLKIDVAAPADFQERIRSRFPAYKESRVVPFAVDLPADVTNLIPNEWRVGKVAYEFISADEIWKVTLTRESIALTTKKYERWEQFKEFLKLAVDALAGIYAPAFYTRVGLRYKDIIQRTPLGLAGTPWSELLRPHIAGELSVPEISGSIETAGRQLILSLDGQAKVLLQHGLLSGDKGEICYAIDADFWTEKRTEAKDVLTLLDQFNRQSGNLFRWCISDRLHNAMGPRPI